MYLQLLKLLIYILSINPKFYKFYFRIFYLSTFRFFMFLFGSFCYILAKMTKSRFYFLETTVQISMFFCGFFVFSKISPLKTGIFLYIFYIFFTFFYHF